MKRSYFIFSMQKNIFFAFLVFTLIACGPSKKEYNDLKLENVSLLSQIDSLNNELDAYRYAPSKLLADARLVAQNKDKVGVVQILDQIKKYHPEAIECAEVQKLLDRLEAEEKAKIAAEERKKEQERQERLRAVKKLKKEVDDVQQITWYYNPYFTHYNNTNLTSLYMGERNGNVWLRLKMSYTGDDWIFFEQAFLSYDGNTQQIFFNKYDDKETDNASGDVWEWIDVSVSESHLAFLKEMVNGKSVKMQLTGKYTKTRTLSANEKRAIKEMILAYEVLQAENYWKQ